MIGSLYIFFTTNAFTVNKMLIYLPPADVRFIVVDIGAAVVLPWRLASCNDYLNHEKKAQRAIDDTGKYTIAKLTDGSVAGSIFIFT